MKTVYMRHIRAAGLCSRGLRKFAEDNRLDWDRFLAEGMPIEDVRKIDDAMAQRVADIAEAEEENG